LNKNCKNFAILLTDFQPEHWYATLIRTVPFGSTKLYPGRLACEETHFMDRERERIPGYCLEAVREGLRLIVAVNLDPVALVNLQNLIVDEYQDLNPIDQQFVDELISRCVRHLLFLPAPTPLSSRQAQTLNCRAARTRKSVAMIRQEEAKNC
jgi:hypothetical protein